MGFRIKYRRITVKLDFNPRSGVCEACGRKGKTDLHHTKYAYKTSEVRKKPMLALHHTIELDFHCHRIANAVQLIEKYPIKTKKIKELMEVKLRVYLK